MYTRRQFLQLTGIAALGSQLSPSLRFIHALVPDAPALQGRALTASTVYARPSLNAAPAVRLWPDTVTPIHAAQGDWYRLPEGFAPRSDIQPMKPGTPAAVQTPDAPFWAEVIAPAASVRACCAANAPLVTRIGHGGILRVVDYLPDSPSPWYGVADEIGALLGWTPAVHWQRVDGSEIASSGLALELDTRSQQLTAWEDGRAILQAPCSIGQSVRRGVYAVQTRQTGGVRLRLDDASDVHGVPWRVAFGAFDLTGAYWHNRFGAAVPGAAVQVTPVLAQWLYAALGQRGSVAVV
ncbi:MAG: L,D-transpeptidase [Chloroflexi bacterium]|nr:L,D-transpeptidase [Chloroflexota bacterium]